jgi:hypothetical protein
MEHCAATAYELMALTAPERPTPSLDAAVAMVQGRIAR